MEVLQRTANRGSVSTGPYQIDNSVKMEADNTEYLNRVIASGGNRKTWTISAWVKRTEISDASHGGGHTIFAVNVSGNEGCLLRFNTGTTAATLDTLQIDIGAGSTLSRSHTNQVFRDTSAWYHIVLAVDTTQSTDTDRFKLYVNGELVTSYYSRNNPAQDFDTSNNQAANSCTQHIGAYTSGGTSYGKFCGYIAEVNHVDGTALAPTAFGEVDDDTGIWIPIKASPTYGTNGFFLDFEDGANMGDDESGNGLDFTEVNITAADQATDTPTNNFCTWSPLWAEPRANGTISEGATQVAWGGSAWKIARSSMAVSKGRWYWEIKAANVTGDTWNNNLFGFASVDGEDGQYGPSVLIGYSTGNYYYRVADSQTGDSSTGWDSGGAWSSSDTFGFALDLESSTKKFILYRNGSAVNGSGTDLVSAFQTEQFFTPYATSYNGDTQFLNFGGYTVNTISSAASDANGYGTFEYAPPSGYYALCTKNLAEFG